MIVTARSPKAIAKARQEAGQRAYAETLREGQHERWLDAQASTEATEAWKAWMTAKLKETK